MDKTICYSFHLVHVLFSEYFHVVVFGSKLSKINRIFHKVSITEKIEAGNIYDNFSFVMNGLGCMSILQIKSLQFWRS